MVYYWFCYWVFFMMVGFSDGNWWLVFWVDIFLMSFFSGVVLVLRCFCSEGVVKLYITVVVVVGWFIFVFGGFSCCP